MAEIRTLTTLATKRDEIVRSIEAYEAKLDQARADLSHINAVMVLFAHDPAQMLDYKPYSSMAKLFGYGELARLCKAALEAGGEMTGAEIAAKVIEAKGLDGRDLVLAKTLTLQVAHTMNSLMQRKTVRRVGMRKLNKRKPMRIWALP